VTTQIEQFSFAILGCFLTACVIPILLKLKFSQSLLDKPNHRSMHTIPTPKIGGLVFIPVSFLICLISQINNLANLKLLAPFAVALFITYALGAADDRLGLTAIRRLFLQFASAFLCWFGVFLMTNSLASISSALGPWFFVFSCAAIVLIVWSINLVNFMDGANGLVALVSSVGLLCLATLVPDQKIRIAIFGLLGSLMAFLYFNVVAKKIFMGDAGSTCLGLIIGTFCFWGAIENHWDWPVGLITFGPLLFDSTLTLIGRVFKGERFWEGHRSHLYQRLISECKLSHLRVSVYYALATATGFFVICVTLSSSLLMRYSAAALVGVTYICIYYILNRWISAKKSVFAQ
jgi:UDP-N-acetylmuramyl pentapeptide phosphotransferase/UDP-N-acetylglucosamine-1-phosphate transferase